VASLSQGRTAAAQCGLFTHKSVPVIFEPPCTWHYLSAWQRDRRNEKRENGGGGGRREGKFSITI